MQTVSVSHSLLLKALASEIKRQNFGSYEVEIGQIEAVTEDGQAFPIVGLRLTTKRVAVEPPSTTPLGKLRLAAVDGEAL